MVAARALPNLIELYTKMQSTLESQKPLFAETVASLEAAMDDHAFDANGMLSKRSRLILYLITRSRALRNKT